MPRIRVDFDCPKCRHHYSGELVAPYPDFSAERSRDMTVVESEYVACEKCGCDIEIEMISEMHGVSAQIVDEEVPISVETIYEPEEPDEDYDYVPPHDVYAEFDEAQLELQHLLSTSVDLLADVVPEPPPALVRMVFSQLVAVLEAYLADRLHRETIDGPKVKLRLVRANVFNDQKITLRAAIADPGLAERTFVETIKSVLYHDLDKVENLYKIAFATSKVFPSTDNRKKLEAAVKLRHHCVHRNGKDKDGNPQAISSNDVERVAKAMRELVDHIEQAIAACRVKDGEQEAQPKSGQPQDSAAPE